MATRSTIAIEHDNGNIQQVYCHVDGYLDGNGETLRDHYSTHAALQELINLGDMSGLEKSIDKCIFYGRDRGEPDTAARNYQHYDDYLDNGGFEEFNYILRQDGVWYVDRGESGKFIPLSEAFAKKQAY
jgi:hypothetical protein